MEEHAGHCMSKGQVKNNNFYTVWFYIGIYLEFLRNFEFKLHVNNCKFFYTGYNNINTFQ